MKYHTVSKSERPVKYVRVQAATEDSAIAVRIPQAPVLKYGVKKRKGGGRHKLWKPRAITPDDLERGWAFVNKWGPKIATRERVRKDYETVLALSNSPSSIDTVVGTLGQMIPVLSAGTCENYMRFITTKFHHTDNSRVIKACESAHADAETTHAVDLSDETLDEIFCRSPPKYRLAFYLLRNAGLRTAAIVRLRGRQISASESALEVQVRIDKNRKKRALRTLLCVPWEWIGYPPDDIINLINNLKDDERPCEGFSASMLNDVLKRHMIQGLAEKCTTYSFRRSFVNFIIKQCQGAKLVITNYTLHLRPTMVDAHYKVWKKVTDALERKRAEMKEVC